jgi:hypothetical protein
MPAWAGIGSAGDCRRPSVDYEAAGGTLQDRRVVQTSPLKASGLKIGEDPEQGDGPVMERRRRRQELIEGKPTASRRGSLKEA